MITLCHCCFVDVDDARSNLFQFFHCARASDHYSREIRLCVLAGVQMRNNHVSSEMHLKVIHACQVRN